MKRILFFIVMIAMCSCMSSCNSVTEKDIEISQSSEHNEEVLLDDIIENETFNSQTDNCNFLSYPDIAIAEDGYYYFKKSYLYYRDKEREKSVIVCTQSNCSHSTDTCDGYFSNSYFRTEQGIWYYDDHLYFLGNQNGLKNYVLYRINMDGTEREVVTELFKLEGAEDMIQAITIHRGYLYYSLNTYDNDGKLSDTLFQVNIKKGAKPVELFHTNIDRSYVYRIKGYGDGVFFQIGEYHDEEYTDFHASLWYCTDEGTATHVQDEVWKDYNIIDGKIYYTTDTKVEAYDWNTKEVAVFVDLGRVCNISYDDTYIYLDDYYGVMFDETIETSSRRIYVMSRTGDIVNSWNIPTHDSDLCLFGDESYLWLNRYPNNAMSGQDEMLLYALPKSDLDADIDGWKRWD